MMKKRIPKEALMSARQSIALMAAREGVPTALIKAHINEAIAAGLKSSDPAAKQFWASIPRTGGKPTPEEVIAWIAMNEGRSRLTGI